MGYADESEQAVIELTYNWGVDRYELGNAYGHIAIAVEDIYGTCDKIKSLGGKVTGKQANETWFHRHCLCGRSKRL